MSIFSILFRTLPALYDIDSMFRSFHTGTDMDQIRRARRKIHRAKMYKRYRGQIKSRKHSKCK